MNDRDMMYRDDSFGIPEGLPERLVNELKELDSRYGGNDWYVFSQQLDKVEVLIKAYHVHGVVSDKDLDTLFRRYGLR